MRIPLFCIPAATALLFSVSPAGLADVEVAKLLFEPVMLIDGVPTVAHPLVTLAAAEASIPAIVASADSALDERQQKRADIERYLAVIGENEASEGFPSDQLREDLFSTALLYQQLGEHDNALKIFQRALDVDPGNNGLERLYQIEILEAMAQSYRALEKPAYADEMMDSAYALQVKAYGADTAQLVPAQRRLGDWNTQAFMERSSILINIPRMNVQNLMVDPRNYMQGSRDPRDTPLFKLYQARGNYLTAIKTLVDAQNFTHPELMELERKLLTNFFLTTHRENILYEPDFYLTRKKADTGSRLNQNSIEIMKSEDYDLGKQSLQRRMNYLVSDPNRTPQQIVTAMLEEADWDLLFERKTVAVDKYDKAYQFFAENPQFAQYAGELIHPVVPVVLPTYLPPPNSRAKLGIAADANVNYFGYIDVSFTLNEFGKARRIKQIGSGGEITGNMEMRMNQYLRNVQFRPRYKGAERDTTVLTLRYYVGL